jgi:choline kinase
MRRVAWQLIRRGFNNVVLNDRCCGVLSMKVVMLAAGIGARLGLSDTEQSDKILLRFGGKSLLQYHVEILKRLGAHELVLGVGYHHQDIDREIAAIGAQDFVRTVFNERYEDGNIVTLWVLRNELDCGESVLLMDADVLYDDGLIKRLINSRHQNCFLLDREFDSGDEPVKLCVRNGKIIEFRKWLSAEFDFSGESVGFFKLSADMAKKLITQTGHYIRQGRRQEPYEEAIRDVLLTSPDDTFSFEDITGMAWIEIDFAADIERAENEILPCILSSIDNRSKAVIIKQPLDQGEKRIQ